MTAIVASTITTITNPVSNPITITNAALTTKIPDSTGIFDELMTSVREHLETQYDKDRITGEEFGKLYVSAMGQAMQTAVSFLLGRETANLQNLLLKEQIYTAQLENGRKIEEVLTQQKQQQLIDAQIVGMDKDNDLKDKELLIKIQQENFIEEQTNNLVKDLALKDKNILLIQEQIDTAVAQQTLINKDVDIRDKQLDLYDEQIDSERAKTKNTLAGGGTIAGTIAIDKEIKQAQKAVYEQQSASFVLDGKYKTAQLYSSAHIAFKAQDEGLAAITQFENTTVNNVMAALKTASGL
jgi:hypothetical protein